MDRGRGETFPNRGATRGNGVAPSPGAPFCLAWANQAWTRTWLGTGETLIDQPYTVEDDIEHGRWLAETFADRRYIRVNGRPLFAVYRPGDLPDPARTCDTWRKICT